MPPRRQDPQVYNIPPGGAQEARLPMGTRWWAWSCGAGNFTCTLKASGLPTAGLVIEQLVGPATSAVHPGIGDNAILNFSGATGNVVVFALVEGD